VRGRKLRAEYSWLWLLTGFVIFVLVVWYDLLVKLTALIGAVEPTTTLFIFGIIFLIFVSLHFAIRVSQLSDQVKNLAQKISLLEAQIDQSSR
jgi:amino acid transporter